MAVSRKGKSYDEIQAQLARIKKLDTERARKRMAQFGAGNTSKITGGQTKLGKYAENVGKGYLQRLSEKKSFQKGIDGENADAAYARKYASNTYRGIVTG